MLAKKTLVLSVIWCCLILFGGIRPLLSVEPVQGAFGFRFGAEFDPSDTPASFTTLNGNRAYFFMPLYPSQHFDRYLVQVTPLTNKIHTIIAVGPKASKEACEEDRAAVVDGLTAKHGASFRWMPARGVPFEGDYDIFLQPDQKRGVGVTCSEASVVTLQLIYVDDDLTNSAELERQQVAQQQLGKRML